MKHVYFLNSEFTLIYTQDIHKNIHTTSLKFTVHIHNIEKFNSHSLFTTIFTTSVINIHVVSKNINRDYSSKTKSFIIA
jgi:hypothetical protein